MSDIKQYKKYNQTRSHLTVVVSGLRHSNRNTHHNGDDEN